MMIRTGMFRQALGGAALLALIGITACAPQVQNRGAIITESMLEQIPEGSSEEQVLVVLGTPSTTSTIDGQTYYYISAKAERPVAFMNPRIVEQRVVAVYFDDKRQVTRVADYGLQDGAVFDFVSRTTPTVGREQTFVRQLLGLVGGF